MDKEEIIQFCLLLPNYHMNKQHWNTIITSDKIDASLVEQLIEQSYELTKSKKVK